MLREIDQQDLKQILGWRNMPDVRQNMFTDHEISWDEHWQWWQRYQKDKTKLSLIYIEKNVPKGVVNFFDINEKESSCHWGFYLASEFNDLSEKIRTWETLEQEAIDYAFSILNCHHLLCETFRFNKPVLEMHKRLGFIETETMFRQKNNQLEEVVITQIDKPFIRFQAKCLLLGSSNLDFIIMSLEKNMWNILNHLRVNINLPRLQQFF